MYSDTLGAMLMILFCMFCTHFSDAANGPPYVDEQGLVLVPDTAKRCRAVISIEASWQGLVIVRIHA